VTSNEETGTVRAATTITTASIDPAQRAKGAGQTTLARSCYVRQRNGMRNMQPHRHPDTSAKRLHDACICCAHIAQKMSTDVHRF
jgi:L-amino acid N-acyltransferase YncA